MREDSDGNRNLLRIATRSHQFAFEEHQGLCHVGANMGWNFSLWHQGTGSEADATLGCIGLELRGHGQWWEQGGYPPAVPWAWK